MIIKQSKYKTADSRAWLEKWLDGVLTENQLDYRRLEVPTFLGATSVLAKNHELKELEPVVFLPGGRTCGIFWDVNNNLAPLYDDYRIYLVDVNGQPGLSEGNAPLIDSDGYGKWLVELLSGLDLNEASFVGTSFGGSLIMKLAEVKNEAIRKAILCNPAGFVNISLSPKNLFYLLMPLVFPNERNVDNFLDKIVFHKDFVMEQKKHAQIAEFLLYTNQNFQIKTENPRPFADKTLKALKAPTYLLLDRDDRFIDQTKNAGKSRKGFAEFGQNRLARKTRAWD